MRHLVVRVLLLTGMTQNVDIKALANLAQLEISDAEVKKLEKEIPAILSFVESIQQVSSEVKEETPEQRNVMRDDVSPHESSAYSEDLLAAAPMQRENQIVVKQVISRKK